MTNVQLGKVWSILSLFVVYYAVNTWMVSQGGNTILDAKLVDSNRVPACVFGIIICSLTLIVTALLGRRYARRAVTENSPNHTGWFDRIPIVGFAKLDMSRRDGRVYQGAVLAALLILPLASLVHFWDRVLGARVATTGPNSVDVGVFDFSVGLANINDPARICSSTGEANSCVDGSSFIPGVEPLLMAIATAAAIILIAMQLLAIFRR